jgi:uncharacterized protein (TIGR03437 family)
LTVAPAEVKFTYRRDDATPPLPQSVTVFSNMAATAFTASAATCSGGNWLSVTPASGQAPASVSVAVNVGSLAAGTYSGQITINAPSASPSALTVPVSLTVASIPPAQLSVSPPVVTIATVQGGPAVSQQLVISNLGGGTLNFTGTATGGNWLIASSVSGTATPGTPAVVGLTLSPSGLSPGTYRGQIVVRTTDGTQSVTVPITLAVNGQAQSIVLTQTGLQFTAVSGGVAPPPQTFSVLNGGVGTMNWAVAAQMISGANWLSITPSSGSSTAGAALNTPVVVNVNPGNMAAGLYYGLVRVTAAGTGNSPQLVSVVLNVLAPGNLPPPNISFVGLLPVGLAGGPNATDTTTLYNVTNQAQTFNSAVSTQDGGAWLSVNPSSGTLPASGSTQLTVQVNSAGLTAGVRYGVVRLAFPDGTVRTLSVVSVLSPAPGGSAEARAAEPVAGCTPKSLAVVVQSLEAGFSVVASQPVPVQAKIVDNCNNPIQSGLVSMSFANKDPSLTMVPGNGVWSATWTPRNPGTSVYLLVTAGSLSGVSTIYGEAQVTGTVKSAPSTSAAAPNLIANSASYLSPGQISPGSWVSIFGDRMADATGLGNTVPFPNVLNGTQALLGEIPLPVLYVSATQVNALIPYSLSANANHQLRIQRNGTSSDLLDVTVADVLPAIYTTNQSGSGQGAIQIANTGFLAAPGPGSRPVQRGEFLQIYASGLGPVENTPADGAAAPASEPLARMKLTATITIGGAPVTNVVYAGLAPGLVGLYQINVQVPDGATTGDAVPVVVTVGGNASNTVTIAVQARQ